MENWEVKVSQGKIYDYLGMILDYMVKGQVMMDMQDYVKKMLQEYPSNDLKDTIKGPWSKDLFKVKSESPNLSKEKKEQFHKTTYQGLFLCKRGRPDIMPGIVYCTTRVLYPNKDDWKKLKKIMIFLNQTWSKC